MKKKIIYSSALTALLSASAVFAGGPDIIVQPDYFTGIYIGGTVAVHHASLDENSSVYNSGSITTITNDSSPALDVDAFTFISPAGTVITNTADGSSWDVFGGVVGGIGKVFNHQWYLGAVGFGEWGDQDDQTTNVRTNNSTIILSDELTSPPGAFINSNSNVTSTTKTRLNNLYGAAAKLGYLITPKTMVFGKVGAAWANVKVSNSITANASTTITSDFAADGTPADISNFTGSISGSSSNDDTKTSIFLGIGGEQLVTDHVSVSLEYDYANFGSVTTNTSLTATGSSVVFDEGTITSAGNSFGPSAISSSATGSARVSNLLLAVNWYFNEWF